LSAQIDFQKGENKEEMEAAPVSFVLINLRLINNRRV